MWHEVLKRRRTELGMTQAQLAVLVGVDKRQIRRYEAGEQEPSISLGRRIADALDISVGELAGVPTHEVHLAGDWWMAWQTFREGVERIAVQEVRFRQEGQLIQMETITRGLTEAQGGGYLWRGELRLWDNEILIGWYAATNEATRSKGALYFVLHPKGASMYGRWVGQSFDGKVITGWGGAGRAREDAENAIEELKAAEES